MSIFLSRKQLRRAELMENRPQVSGKSRKTKVKKQTLTLATRAATRDASWYKNPSVYGPEIKYHAVADSVGVSGCSLFLVVDHMRIDQTVNAETVKPAMRCMRPGCKVLWPVYKPTQSR